MQAVEFQTTIKNGTIEIPQNLRDQIGSRVRVIVLSVEHRTTATTAIDELLAHPVKVPGFQPLTREEAHAR